MLPSLIHKLACSYVGTSSGKQYGDFLMAVIVSTLPGLLIRLLGGPIIIAAAVMVVGSLLAMWCARVVQRRMEELVRSNPDLAGAWSVPDDSSTLD